MGSVKKKINKVMNKVADKIMPKEIAKIAPYLAMAAPFLGPVGMMATLPLQALSDAKNYGKLNYKKLALQAAMTGIAKTAQGQKALSGEKAFMDKGIADVGGTTAPIQMGGATNVMSASPNAMSYAANNPDAFSSFMENYTPTMGDRLGDYITSAGRKMYMPLDKGIMNMDRLKQATALAVPMSTYAGLDAMDQFNMQKGSGSSTGGGANASDMAQAHYDSFNLYGKKAGYTQDEINKLYGPMGAMYGGEYNQIAGDPNEPVWLQYPETNYNLTTTTPQNWTPMYQYGYANGGRIGYAEGPGPAGVQPLTEEEWQALDPNAEAPAPGSYLGEPEFSARTQAANEEAMAEIMRLISGTEMGEGFDLERLLEGNANGGRIGFNWGGWSSPEDADDHAQRMFNKEYKDLTPDELDEFEEEMDRLRNKFSDSGNMQMASAPDPMAERMDTLENMALEQYGKSLDKLSPKEIEILEFNLNEMNQNDFYNTGGRVHRNIGGIMNAPAVTTPGQAMMPPKGTQWDGRQGGFMPMGEAPQADDVPAMLSKDEFVMTRDAVKAAGNGDVNKGAQVMYDLMNNLEARV